jgi:3-hydroxyacyl-[acyl-carrier-protein] dehydratase
MNEFYGLADLESALQIGQPFLMIDCIDLIDPGIFAAGKKMLNKDDWYFQSHMKSMPVMPGVLLVESMLQTFAFLIYTINNHKGNLAFVTHVDIKFHKSAYPGDLIITKAAISTFRHGVTKGTVSAMVGNEIISSGNVSYVSPHAFPKPLTN